MATGLTTVPTSSSEVRNKPGMLSQNDTAPYSDWIPASPHADPDGGVYFTHVDWETVIALEDDEEPTDDDEIGAVAEQVPIIGLPLYGALITPLALFGILFYPFGEHVLPQNGQPVDGIETARSTWVDDLLVFQGEYSPEVFAQEYAEGFTEEEPQNGFSIFVADDQLFGPMAYAVSDDTLIVGMHPGEEDTYDPESVVNAALDRRLDETGRMSDDDDGQWLLETTGDAQMAFGGWQMEDLGTALDPDVEEGDDTAPESEPDIAENPVFDSVESLLNTIVFTPEGGEMRDIEARYAGVYPENDVPTEDEVVEYLIGDPNVPHEITIDGTRVHATASFDEQPIE